MQQEAASRGAYLRTVIRASRPSFLLLTPLCVMLGAGTAVAAGEDLDSWRLVLILVGALMAHAAVNLFNEYDDFRSGLDLQTRRTPFSGGSGALPAQPAAASSVRIAAWASLVIVVGIGLLLVVAAGPGLLALGLPGLVLILAYSGWITRSPLPCLVAPGLGVALIVPGTHYALVGSFAIEAFLAALIPLFLGSALLLLNQFPDVEADRQAQRRHLPIVLGRRRAADIFGLLVAASYVSLALSVLAGRLPIGAAAGLLSLPVGLLVASRVRRHATNAAALVPWMGGNVATLLVTLALVGTGLLLA
ncbi:prenyltransferase [Thioalkalivibrio sp.]|uniref:prenyltransferase n=1 Tax=Thioalkalivibrio sp. TaxID=2093813 RepID=UPI00356774B5